MSALLYFSETKRQLSNFWSANHVDEVRLVAITAIIKLTDSWQNINDNFIYQLLQHFQNFTFYISYYAHSEQWLFPQTPLTDWRRSLSSVI